MAEPHPEAYLNGVFLPLAEARVPVMDRGFLFGDSVYEVIPVYSGRPFRLAAHLARLEHSLSAIELANPHSPDDWERLTRTLIGRNGGGDMSVYVQVSRGADVHRDHLIPGQIPPTVFAMAAPLSGIGEDIEREGVAAITLEDTRWARCDIKSTSLLANVLLRSRAQAAGAAEAILHRDGQLTEGAASSLFVVRDETVMTPPNGYSLLPGTTRDFIMELAAEQDISAVECRMGVEVLAAAGEIWLCSATREVVPVTRLNGKPVGAGTPGPVWRRIYGAFQAHKARLVESAA